MTGWADGTLWGADTETTGIEPDTARIVTATIVEVDGNGMRTAEWLADPGVDIPAAAAAIHGISTEHAREHGRPAADVLAEVVGELHRAWNNGDPVVIYNASYDLTVIARECDRHGLGPFRVTGPVIDPFVIDKHVDRYRKGSRKLADVCQHYRVQLGDGGAHNATADTIGATRVAWRIAQRYPEIGRTDPNQLHRLQIGWYADQADSLADYRHRRGETAAIPREWPIRTVTLHQATAGSGPATRTSRPGGNHPATLS